MKYKLLFFLIFIIVSCGNGVNKNNMNNIISRNEIEPNNTLEYSQFIDTDMHINASFNNSNDIDYYHISPTNGFAMDLSISVHNKNANIQLELFDTNNNDLIKFNTRDISDYNLSINLKDVIFEENYYFLCLRSDMESKYELNLKFKDNIIINNEIEPNDTINNANSINTPNELIYGYFMKKNLDIIIDDYIKPYIKQNTIIDIDCFKIKNSTDINTSINIILNDAENIDMVLFDENFNYIKSGINKITTDFLSNRVYYLALICYGDKSFLKRYSLHYEFN